MAQMKGGEVPVPQILRIIKHWTRDSREQIVQHTISYPHVGLPDSSPTPTRFARVVNLSGPIEVIGNRAPTDDPQIIITGTIRAFTRERARKKHDALERSLTVSTDERGAPQVSIDRRPFGILGKLFAPEVHVNIGTPENTPVKLDLSTHEGAVSAVNVSFEKGSELHTISGGILVNLSNSRGLRTQTYRGYVSVEHFDGVSEHDVSQGRFVGEGIEGRTIITGKTVDVSLWDSSGSVSVKKSGGNTLITGKVPPADNDQTAPGTPDSQNSLDVTVISPEGPTKVTDIDGRVDIRTGDEVTIIDSTIEAAVNGGYGEVDLQGVRFKGKPSHIVTTAGNIGLTEVGEEALLVTAHTFGEIPEIDGFKIDSRGDKPAVHGQVVDAHRGNLAKGGIRKVTLISHLGNIRAVNNAA